MDKNNFRKDFFLEIIQDIDSYSARKIFNLYAFTIETSIYELKKAICVLDEINTIFCLKLATDDNEYVYQSQKNDKNDKKIYKFIKKFIERDDLDYNIVMSNLSNVLKYKDIDFVKLELFKNKILKNKEGGCEYEF